MTQCGHSMRMRVMTDYDDFIDLHIPLPQTNAPYSTVIKELVETIILLDGNKKSFMTGTYGQLTALLQKEIDISLKHQQDYIDEYEKSKAKPELTGNVTELRPKGK